MSIQSPDSMSNSDVQAHPAAKVFFTADILPDGSSAGDGSTNGSVVEEDDESKPLLSTTSSRWTSNTAGSPSHENKEQRRKRWISIYIMYFTMFVTSLNFSLVISSIWPYLLQVDYRNATPMFLGWVVASYSIGMLVSAPLLGLWADYRPAREPLFVSMILNVLFNLLYSYCGVFQSGVAGWVMLCARLVTGLAAGIGGVCRSTVAESTYPKERIGAMASIGSAQSFGFVIGPVMGLAFIPLGSSGIYIHAIKFQLSMLTAPGYIGAVLGIVNFIVLIFFREYKLESREIKRKRLKEEALKKKEETLRKQTMKESRLLGFAVDTPKKHYDRLGAMAAIVLFFVVMSGFSVFETLLSPLTMDEFGWNKKQVLLYNNLIYAGLSIITITVLNTIKYVTKRVQERVVLMAGLFFGAFGFFVILPMSSEPPELITISTLHHTLPDNTSIPMIPLVSSNETAPTLGCREPPLMWCSHVPRILLPQLIVSLVVMTFSYSMATVTSFSIFSRILGPFPQGVMMGILTAMGSLARGVGPMTMGLLYEHYGPLVTFGTMSGLYMVAIVFMLVFFTRLVPYERYAGSYGAPR